MRFKNKTTKSFNLTLDELEYLFEQVLESRFESARGSGGGPCLELFKVGLKDLIEDTLVRKLNETLNN